MSSCTCNPVPSSDLRTSCSESFYESEQLAKDARDLAALLASKVYYYLGEYDEALSFALGAGSAFQAETREYTSGEYVETIVCACPTCLVWGRHLYFVCHIAKAIDRYIYQRADDVSMGTKTDPRLQSIIEAIFQRCIDEGEYRQVHFIIFGGCVSLC
jgi:26S proteasome regulatory subunit N2